MKCFRIIILFVITITFTSCEDFFEFSVYEANVKASQKNTTVKNLKLIENIQVASQDFKFAFITDVHYFYDNLKTVIDDINKRDDILFVVFGGDNADQALLKEYEIFYEVMTNLNKPYITVIGNHDYNSNGGLIYKKMFGAYNYSFEFNNNKFVLFDDVSRESNKDPDFNWLSTELSDNKMFNQVFVIAHIPPFDNRFTTDMEQTYKSLMKENNVSLSIHGHTHSYFYEKNTVSYLIVPALRDLTYGIVNVKDKGFNVELIEL